MSNSYKVGVVGAGNMGSGIAQKMAQEGLDVILVDMKPEFVERGLGIIKKMLQEGVERKVFTPKQMDETLSRIKGTVSYEDLADADLVVEAVFEDKKVKGELLKRLDEVCDSKTILATNTSSFYVSELAQWTNRHDKVVGMHYFFHPAKNRLLEVIPHEGTSQETLDKALLIGKLHGKTNIVVKDAPGFAVNRFFVPFLTSSVRALEEGIANIPTIEVAAKKAFAIGMGPFELMNVTGIPIAAHASNTLGNEFGEFYATPQLLDKQTESGQLWDLSGDVDESKLQEVMDFLYGTTLGVACQLVQEGVASIEDTDRGAKIGLRWRFGPFELINRLGVAKAYECVKAITERYSSFNMPQMLEDQYKSGQEFHFQLVDLEIKGDIAYITINRPEAMNALNPVVVGQLEEKFNEAENNPVVKAIAIQGAGKAFIAGADIKYFINNIKNNTLDKTVTFTRKGHELLRRFETSQKRTIAVVDGLSLGGGSELAFSCQAIVATPAGSFGFPETGIGIYPGLGGMLRLARHVGEDLAKYYVFTGKTLRAEDAYELGVVTALTEPGQLEETIRKVAELEAFDKYETREIPEKFSNQTQVLSGDNLQRVLKGELAVDVDEEFAAKTASIIAKKAPIALKVSNELIDAQSKVSIDDAIELELGRLVEIFSTKDALTGLTAPVGKPAMFEAK